mmetsp:Transcript_15540/g.63344  ORF Transcript_15540/g.63344 Transcript_15540/m.63344 type:complete len:198 (-) Transcript_15540:1011-1604(-)
MPTEPGAGSAIAESTTSSFTDRSNLHAVASRLHWEIAESLRNRESVDSRSSGVSDARGLVRAMPEATEANVAKFNYEEIVCPYRAPVQILTDRGANFRSKVVEEYLRLLPTAQRFTSSYHPRTNSTVERWNRMFQEVLVRLTDGAVTRWDRFIHQANMALRMRTSRVTGMSPFEIKRHTRREGGTLAFIDVNTALSV